MEHVPGIQKVFVFDSDDLTYVEGYERVRRCAQNCGAFASEDDITWRVEHMWNSALDLAYHYTPGPPSGADVEA